MSVTKDSNIITLYDIPSTIPGSAWSPNTWKTRYSLNYKGLAYKTIWVEYPDIPTQCKQIGCPPTGIWEDGSPMYTLPAIHDPSTGASISESLLIAQYLDATYPDTPRLIPDGTQALMHAFVKAFNEPLIQAMLPLAALRSTSILNPQSAAYYGRLREKWLGQRLEDVLPLEKDRREKWQQLEDKFGVFDSWFRAASLDGPFVMGSTVTFADFVVAGWLMRIKKLWGTNSEEWKRVESWHEGRWCFLLNNLKQYEIVP